MKNFNIFIMNRSNELSLEQEFKLANYKKQLVKLNAYESKKYLMETLKQMMIKDNLIKYFIQNSNL
uniref:Uncharacterized protein ycf18 n=3 Tax=Corallina TaxID=35169 RepID=A0A6M3WE25_COROI|nr:phycobilisome degradation protein [Corallina officinalis]QJF58599.1 phycobilisome degradation protein [Corallina officinalis]QJF58798.1 phycobilisome degradation protein [Corallina officinalis]QJF58997.1 phycobilisome degradation protein [Corallina officinalis]